jgi:hypothetical protein
MVRSGSPFSKKALGLKKAFSNLSVSVKGDDGREGVVAESIYFPGTGGPEGTVSKTFLGIGGGRGFSNRGADVGGFGGRGGGSGADSSWR